MIRHLRKLSCLKIHSFQLLRIHYLWLSCFSIIFLFASWLFPSNPIWLLELRNCHSFMWFFSCVARQNVDCADGNKDIKMEATLLIPRQQVQPNQAVKSRHETAPIRLCDTYKRYGSSPIDRIPRRGQIVCFGSDLNQNRNLHRMFQHQTSWTESETAKSELNAQRVQ